MAYGKVGLAPGQSYGPYGPIGDYKRTGYDANGNFLGDLSSAGFNRNPDGSYSGDNSSYWQSMGYAPGQTPFTDGTWGRQQQQSQGTWGQQPQVMPGYTPPSGTTNATQGWNSPPVNPNSATAQNPFLNLGLNAFSNTQQGFDTSWLDNLSKSLYDAADYNFMTNLAPTLDSNAIMAGGFGGDRAAIAKGVVMDRMNQNVTNAMAPQYAAAYNSSLDRALQGGQAAAQTGMGLEDADLRRLLGIGQLGIQQQNADTNTAQVAANSAGVPTYTNPYAAGVGGALSLAQLLNMIFGNQG